MNQPRRIKQDDWPFSFTVPYMAKRLEINLTRAYELARREDFKATIRLGKRIVIIRDLFLDFLEREAHKSD